LQWLRGSPTLQRVTHLIIDEIHERSVESDFLMTLCKKILPARPDLKLILMSATMDSNKFSRYFNRCPSLNIPGFTFPVEQFYLEDVIEMTRYNKEFNDNSSGGGRGGYRNYYSKRGRDRAAQGLEYAELMQPFLRDIQGKYSRRTLEFLEHPSCEDLDMNLAAALVRHIHTKQDDGAILVFVPGWEQISKLSMLLDQKGEYALRSAQILPLHSLMPTVNQKAIFAKPPMGIRKVVIATNIAETSITIEDVVYVVDCGKIKISNFDVNNNISTLQPEWISVANLKQREGRAGRTQPGKCYHLLTSYRKEMLQPYLPPEICRKRIEEVILQIKMLELGSSRNFLKTLLDPPNVKAVEHSLNLLVDINALVLKNETEELTPLGFHLAKLPLDPQTGKMIVMAAMFSCIDPVLSVAASLSFKDAFVVPFGRAKEVDKVKQRFGSGTLSDHLMLANVIIDYNDSDDKSLFCWQNFLSQSTIKMLISMKSDLCKHLYVNQFIKSSDPLHLDSNRNSNNESLVRAVICAGLYPNTARINKPKRGEHQNTILKGLNDKRILFHPSSILSPEYKFSYPWVVYHLKQKSTNVFLFDGTVVSPLSLLFFGAKVTAGEEVLQDGTRLETVQADEFVTFNCDEETSSFVGEARAELDKVILHKLSHPSPTDWESRDGRVLQMVINLLGTELQ